MKENESELIYLPDAQLGANKYSKGYTANIVPTDNQSLAFARTVREVQNIVYGAIDATEGLFFPEVRLAALACLKAGLFAGFTDPNVKYLDR